MSTPVQDLIAQALAAAATDDDDPVRARILAAAIERFQTSGIRRTSVNEIARAAKVGRMTVYRRFPVRDDLVLAAVLGEARRELAVIATVLTPILDVEEQFVEGFVRGIALVRGNPLLSRLRETEPEDFALRLTVGGEPVLALGRAFVAAFLSSAVADGRLRPLDPDATAEVLVRFALSLATLPATVLPVDDEPALREFGRQHLLPIVTGQAPDREPAGAAG